MGAGGSTLAAMWSGSRRWEGKAMAKEADVASEMAMMRGDTSAATMAVGGGASAVVMVANGGASAAVMGAGGSALAAMWCGSRGPDGGDEDDGGGDGDKDGDGDDVVRRHDERADRRQDGRVV